MSMFTVLTYAMLTLVVAVGAHALVEQLVVRRHGWTVWRRPAVRARHVPSIR